MLYALVTLAVAVTALAMARYRRSFLRERPLELAQVEYANASALAHELGQRLGLTPRQSSPGNDWIGDFFLAPVWLFWGDLRTRRPTTRLRRWQLEGASHDRTVHVQLGPDEIRVRVSLHRPIILWAQATLPLDQQEGLRALHPIGEPRWLRVAEHLHALFATGTTDVRTEHDVLIATVSADAFLPDRVNAQLDAQLAVAEDLDS